MRRRNSLNLNALTRRKSFSGAKRRGSISDLLGDDAAEKTTTTSPMKDGTTMEVATVLTDNVFHVIHASRPPVYFCADDGADAQFWLRTLRAALSGVVSSGAVLGLRGEGTFGCIDF